MPTRGWICRTAADCNPPGNACNNSRAPVWTFAASPTANAAPHAASRRL
jgi:hypothetical protein